MSNEKSKKEFFLARWFKRLFTGRKKELSFMEEEALQSPLRNVVRNFTSRRLAMTGLIVFLLIFLFVMVGPYFFPIDLSYQDNTQANVAPGLNMMDLPKELKGNVRDLAAGTTFGAGVDNNGKVYMWGYTRVTEAIDLKNIPEEVQAANIVDIAVGYDHVAALDDAGRIYIWGNDRLGQGDLPKDIKKAMDEGVNLHFKQIEAGYQFTCALTEDGMLYNWGNTNMCDIKVKKSVQGNIDKVATLINNYIVLTKDGSAAYAGMKKNAFATIPENLLSDVVDIAASGFTCAAVKSDGAVTVWGNISHNENAIPEHSARVRKLYGGRFHYTALMDNGDVLSWGDNNFGQAVVPDAVNASRIEDLFAGFYQNYAVTADGDTLTWGLRGYLLGTDHLGRDVLTRIINGGKTTMTVGAVSVVISLFIGIIMGGLAGYFGGKTDIFIMRIAEVVGGLPFLPFALILSAIIGTRISVEQRMYLIMIVLGVLSWPSLCRLVRAQILAQREMEFVTAAKAVGVKEGSIVFKHIIPNVISVILVTATLDFATCMLTESTLSYLGFGISPPTPTWGNMLTGANNSIVIQQYWWRWVFPAAIFSICTICINLIGDGLRDAVDPKSSER